MGWRNVSAGDKPPPYGKLATDFRRPVLVMAPAHAQEEPPASGEAGPALPAQEQSPDEQRWQVIAGAEHVPLNEPVGVVVDGQGNLYVADLGNRRIQKLGPDGQPLAQWGSQGDGPGQFRAPHGVAVDGQGNLYVADYANNRIQKLSPDGQPLAQWGSLGTGPGQFDGPFGVAVDGQGNLYVADRGNHRLQKLPAQEQD